MLRTQTLVTRRVTSLSGLRSLEEAWRTLHSSADLFARYEWHLACAEHLLQDNVGLTYIQVLDGSDTVAILPVISSTKSMLPFGRLRMLSLGLHAHLPLADFPCAPGVGIDELARALRAALDTWPERWDVMCWPRSLTDSNIGKLAFAWEQATTHIEAGSPCNIVDTGRDYADFSVGLSKNLRASLRKSQKRLQEAGGAWLSRNHVPTIDTDKFDIRTAPIATGDQIAAAYTAFLELEASGWKGAAGTRSAIRLDRATFGFYDGLLRQSSEDFAAEVTLLHRSDKAIAAQFAVRVGNCRHVLKIGYDETESQFSPGQVLMDAVLRAACHSDLARVSLVTNMPWHHPWRPLPLTTINILVFRRRWRAALYDGYRALRARIKAVVGRLRRLHASGKDPADAVTQSAVR